MGPIPPSWGLMANTTAIRISDPLSLFVYLMSFTFNFGAFDEEMVLSLKILTLSSIEYASWFSFDVENLVCVSGGRINLEVL